MKNLNKQEEDYILERSREKDYSEMTDEELENERCRIDQLQEEYR